MPTASRSGVQDYRDVADGPYDAIASIGMAEHVGQDLLPAYAARLFDLLRPQGRLLNHAIARRPGPRDEGGSTTSFIDRYVFPDGELEPLATMVDAIEGAGFEVRDVESLREHYAQTLRAWVANLEAGWEQAVALSEPRSRPGVAALHGGFGAGLRGQPPGGPPGAGSASRRAGDLGHAADPGGLRALRPDASRGSHRRGREPCQRQLEWGA